MTNATPHAPAGSAAPTTIAELLAEAPCNWGRWGDDDEVGALNLLGPREVLGAIACVRSWKVFRLQAPVGTEQGDPTTPSRASAVRRQVADAATWRPGGQPLGPGEPKFADDTIDMFLQGTTQVDELGHVWYDDRIWNGYPQDSTLGGLDMARFRGVDVLAKTETFDDRDLEACAAVQVVELRPRDILIVRTGFVGSYWSRERAEFYADWSERVCSTGPSLFAGFTNGKSRAS